MQAFHQNVSSLSLLLLHAFLIAHLSHETFFRSLAFFPCLPNQPVYLSLEESSV